jgi:hypothetical protein
MTMAELRTIAKLKRIVRGKARKLHSKRVGKIGDYTRNEWGIFKLHSKRVGNIEITLETSGEDWRLHSKRVENSIIPFSTNDSRILFTQTYTLRFSDIAFDNGLDSGFLIFSTRFGSGR